MELRFTAGIDRNQFKSDIDAMRRDILGLNNTVKSETSKMDSAFKNLSLGIAGYFSVNAVQGFARELINVRGEFQKTEIAFTTMLGNADQAKSLMNDMVTLAAKTPFSLQDVSSGAKQLLAFQVPANEVVDTLTRLGNIAAGLSVPLSRINLVYGQVKAKGKLMGDDLRQFTEAGIPMVAELAKKFGTTTSAITEMVSAGKIGFKDVQDVLFSMTNEGGMFFNLMEKQSKSLSGQIANLGDAWDQMLNKIGESNEGVLSGTIKEAIFAIENYESIIEIIEGLVLTYGAYKTALMLTSVAQSVASASAIKLTTTEIAAGVAKRTLTGIQATLNATILANPYALAAAAITGLIYAIYKLNTQVTTAQEIQTEFSGILQSHNNKVGETKAKIDALVTAIKSNNTTDEKRKVLISQLNNLTNNKIKGLNAESVRTGQLDAQIKTFIKTLYQQAEAMSYVDQLNSLYAKKRNNEELKNRAKTGDTTIGEYFGALFDKDTYKQNKGDIGLSAKALISARVDEENKAIDEAILRTKKEIDKRGNIIADAQNNAGTKIASGTDATTETIKKQNEEVEKIYGADTIKGLQQRISKLNEVMETSVFGSEKYNIAKSQKTALEAQLKEMTSGFDEQINELKRQFSVRDKLLEQGYSKESVDGMFPDLKDKNFLQSMKDKAKALNDIVNAGKGDSQTKENLVNINEQLRILEGRKTVLEEFTKKLDEAKEGKSSSQYIDFLNSQKTTGGSETDLAKNAEIQKRIEAEIEAQKQRYQEFLAAHQSFEEKRLEISKSYAELRQKIEADTTLNNEQKKNALEKAAQEEADAYSDAFMTELVNNPQYREAFADLDRQTTSQLKKIRENLQKSLSEQKNLNPEAQARIRQEIENLDRVIGERNPYQKLINIIKQLGDESISSSKKMMLINEAADTVTGYVNDVKGIVSDVTGALDDLGIEMSDSAKDTLSNINQTLDGLGKMSEGVKDFATGFITGDPMKMVTGTVKYITGYIKVISAWTNGDKKKERQIKAWANEVANLKVQYQELERAMNKALGDDKYKTQQQEIANLEKQKILLQKMIKKEEDKKKTDKGKIKDWQQQISDINAQIDDLKKSIVDDILQIDVKGLADKIGDALIEGFGRGEDALDSLNKTADEVFKDMVKNALNMELEKRMQPIINDMLKAMGYSEHRDIFGISNGNIFGSFDGLTPEEREALKAQIIAATGDYQKAMEQYADLFGPDAANSPNGLKGDIKGITEKTAGALESQINAIRIYQVEALNVSKRNQQIFLDALKYQAEIAYNTRPLIQIQKDIAELNSKVKKPLAGLSN